MFVSFDLLDNFRESNDIGRGVSVLQGEIYVSSMTCLGKNTANIWIHQVGCGREKEGGD